MSILIVLPTHSLPAKSTNWSLVLTVVQIGGGVPALDREGDGDLERAAALPGAGDLGKKNNRTMLKLTEDTDHPDQIISQLLFDLL